MATPRRMQFICGFMTWMTAAVLVLAVTASLSLELVFVAGVVGLVIIDGLTKSITVQPRWRSTVGQVVSVALVAFAALISYRVLELFAIDLIPW